MAPAEGIDTARPRKCCTGTATSHCPHAFVPGGNSLIVFMSLSCMVLARLPATHLIYLFIYSFILGF